MFLFVICQRSYCLDFFKHELMSAASLLFKKRNITFDLLHLVWNNLKKKFKNLLVRTKVNEKQRSLV